MKRLCQKKLIILTALLLCTTFSSFAQSGDEGGAGRFLANYAASFYNDSNGFPSNEANCVLQTRDGFIWFGGYAGLIRYDGNKYTQWNAITQDGFTSSNVRSLYEQVSVKEGNTLWIGTNDKGLFSFKNGNFKVYDKESGTPANMIRCITERTDGLIFGGSSGGLFYIDNDDTVVAVDLDISVPPFVCSMTADFQNNVFFVLNTGELIAYTHDGKTIQYEENNRFNCVEYISGGRIIAGTQDGDIFIMRFDGENFNTLSVKHTPNKDISSFYEDTVGSIWLTSETGIGFLNRDLSYHHIGNPSGAGFYSGIIEDYEKGYWITATKGGVVKYSVSAFTDYNALVNFPTGSANAVLIDKGKTYIATDSRLFILDENGKPVFTEFSSMINGRVRGLFRDSRNDIWVCTYTRMTAIRFTPDTGAYKIFTTADGLASDRARSFTELQNGVVAIGTTAGVSFIKGDQVISAEEAFETTVSLNLPAFTILSLCISLDGTLYIGTDGIGVFAVNKNGITQYKEEDGLTGGVILRLYPDRRTNGVWVSPSSGLCYIDENKKVHEIEKVPPYAFLDILQYNNELILLTMPQIIRVDLNTLLDPNLPLNYTVAGRSSGLSSTINANTWNFITSDNELYFCCDSGINIYNFEKILSTFIPYAGITKVQVDNEEFVDFSEKIIIPRDSYRTTIELSFLSFGLLETASMYYILEGQDAKEQLMPKTGNMTVSYTNLRGGDYRFLVWTEDPSRKKGNTIEVLLEKELQFLEYPAVWVSFVLLGIFFIAGIFLLIYHQRIRIHKIKQREYRTIITQALTAIANAIDAKDSYTSGHSMRVAAYSVEIARHMGMSKSFIENLYYIGLLHDVGKIGVPNEIINKPGKLTDEEYETMKQHTVIGLHILSSITLIQNLTAGTAEHHEHWNGNGYFRGLSGKSISIEGRIIAIADTYDAMSTNRSYRKRLSKETIVEEFTRCKGSQFDPEITDLVISMIEKDYFYSIDISKIIDIL